MIYLKAKRAVTRKMLKGYGTNPAIDPIKKGDVIEVKSLGTFHVVTFLLFCENIWDPSENFTQISEKAFCKAIDDKHLKKTGAM